MTDVVEDLAAYLDAQVVGWAQGTNLFVGDVPPEPDDLVALVPTPGSPPVDVLGPDAQPAVILPRVQVQARSGPSTPTAGDQYPRARDRAYDAYRALVLVTNEALSGTSYFRVAPLQEPFLLSRDEAERVLFAFNVEVWRVAQ